MEIQALKSKLRTSWTTTRDQAREAVVRGLGALMFRADTTRFLLDRPKFDYQPIPWRGIDKAPVRGEGTFQRWNEIQKYLQLGKHKSLKDIGCCVGFFCISAAEKFGMTSIGFDLNERFLRIARHAVPSNLRMKCHFLNMLIDDESVAVVPSTDVSLCLSVWHHWFFHYGQERATVILRELWKKTNYLMFFETGELETAEEFNLPFKTAEEAKAWNLNYLRTTLPDAKIVEVGEFEAGHYAHYAHQNIKRTLYKIVRE